MLSHFDGRERAAQGTPADSIAELFSHVAARRPETKAVVYRGGGLSYRELDQRAEQLAQQLIDLGVTPEERVSVCLPRSADLVVALLAVVKAGAAYLPFDAAYPRERIRFMLEDAGARILVTSRTHAVLDAELVHTVDVDAIHWRDDPRAAAERSGQRLLPRASDRASNALAYVCYTSGSTGTPKGVAVTHAGVLRLVHQVGYVQLGRGSVVLHAAPAAFDATTFEIWGPLLTGGTCVLYPEAVPNARDLRETISGFGVTTAFLTTALVNAVVDDDPTALAGLRQLLFGGEAVSVSHIARLQAACPKLALVHVYGPTETTTFATAYAIPTPVDPQARSIPIGSAIEQTSLRVLNPDRTPARVGEPGELYIGGAGVARGYLGRPELTQERFVELEGERYYRTGDIVRADQAGDLTFVERVDHQVKIRGHRIELGEIESRLAAVSGIRSSVVVCREDQPGEKRLVAYYCRDAATSVSCEQLRNALAVELPDYMVPRFYVELERLPISTNGKIDRARLPKPSASDADVRRGRVPERDVERQLAALFSSLLDLDAVSVDDDFFQLGGHSLLATRLLARVRSTFGVELSLAHLLESPTVGATAPQIEAILYLRGAPSFDPHATFEELSI